MRRFVLTSVVTAAVALLFASPVLAFQCPKLITQINDNAGNRLDSAAYDAKQKAAEAQKLHAEGKHADSEKIAKEALTMLGVKM